MPARPLNGNRLPGGTRGPLSTPGDAMHPWFLPLTNTTNGREIPSTY